MVNASEEWCGFKSQVIKLVTNTGSNPVLTTNWNKETLFKVMKLELLV